MSDLENYVILRRKKPLNPAMTIVITVAATTPAMCPTFLEAAKPALRV